jgi:hypothetical protein
MQRFAKDIDVSSEKSPEPIDPWIANMGIFQDDPTFDDFLAEVNTYRNAITDRRLLQGKRSATANDTNESHIMAKSQKIGT